MGVFRGKLFEKSFPRTPFKKLYTMKQIYKFLLVAAALFAYSCVTDTTEDLGVGLGNNGGLTEITLSLEASRTQLGEKAGEVYPLYWSEGDAISANGVASAALSATAV